MIDVFITSSGRRPDLLEDVARWWNGIADITAVVRTVRVLYPQRERDQRGRPSLHGFDADRRRIAERDAHSAVYVLTDDDVLPRGEPDPALVQAALAWFHHPTRRFAQLAAWLDNEPIQKLAGDALSVGSVVVTAESGGCRFRRKGLWTEIPETPAPYAHFDEWDAATAHAAGYEVGYLYDFHALHTGKFRSEQWNEGGEALEHARVSEDAAR